MSAPPVEKVAKWMERHSKKKPREGGKRKKFVVEREEERHREREKEREREREESLLRNYGRNAHSRVNAYRALGSFF